MVSCHLPEQKFSLGKWLLPDYDPQMLSEMAYSPEHRKGLPGGSMETGWPRLVGMLL